MPEPESATQAGEPHDRHGSIAISAIIYHRKCGVKARAVAQEVGFDRKALFGDRLYATRGASGPSWSRAREQGPEKIVVTHLLFKVRNLDLDTIEEIARLGAMPEFGYCTVSLAWHYATPELVVEDFPGRRRAVPPGVRQGNAPNPLLSEALRIFAQTLGW